MNTAPLHENYVWPSPGGSLEAWTSRWRHEPNRPHSHDTFQLVRTLSGRGRIQLGSPTFAKRWLDAVPSQVVVIPPHAVHQMLPLRDELWTFDTLFLPSEETPAAVLPEQREAKLLAQDFRRLHKSLTLAAALLEQEHLALRLLRRLGAPQQISPAEPGDRSLARVRDYLHAAWDRPLSMAELAAVADTSAGHLSRAFRRAFGLPPHAYQIQLRVHRARRLLQAGALPAAVALATGFSDQPHFTRHFRRLVGVTPGRFRRAVHATIRVCVPPESRSEN